jgi:hypothetical protein
MASVTFRSARQRIVTAEQVRSASCYHPSATLLHLTNALYLDRRDDVNQYLHVMDRISMRAAPPDKTVDILHKILQES